MTVLSFGFAIFESIFNNINNIDLIFNFLNTYYDGKIRLDLIPNANLNAHKNVTKSNK